MRMDIKGTDLEIVHLAIKGFKKKTKRMADDENGIAGFVSGGQFKDLHSRVERLESEIEIALKDTTK